MHKRLFKVDAKKIGGDTGYAGTANRNLCKEMGIQTSFVRRGRPATEKNILVHDYYKIRLNEVWKVVKEDLKPLQEQITRYLAETNWEEWEKNEVVIVESAVHKNLVQTARRMKKDGMDDRQISRYTGLSVEEIDTL